jgi:hypothetical protein
MAVFYISLISCFPGLLLRFCLSVFEMVPVTYIIYWCKVCFHIIIIIIIAVKRLQETTFLLP